MFPLLSSVVEDLLKCLYKNGHCQHFCDGSGERRKCFCADGYKLGADERECVAQGTNTTTTTTTRKPSNTRHEAGAREYFGIFA